MITMEQHEGTTELNVVGGTQVTVQLDGFDPDERVMVTVVKAEKWKT